MQVAYRAEIKTILLPRWNAKGLLERVGDHIKFHFMAKMIDTLKIGTKE